MAAAAAAVEAGTVVVMFSKVRAAETVSSIHVLSVQNLEGEIAGKIARVEKCEKSLCT